MNMERYKRLRDLREDHDMTQKAVGEAINVPQRTYAYYESGQRMIPRPVRRQRGLPAGAHGQNRGIRRERRVFLPLQEDGFRASEREVLLPTAAKVPKNAA